MAAEASRNWLSESEIPTGLNRIKTWRVASLKDKARRSLRAEDSEKLNCESPSSSRPHVKQKLRAMVKGRVTINSPREGLKTKRIVRWFTLHLYKDSNQVVNDVPQQLDVRMKKHSTAKQSSSEGTSNHKMHNGLKSYSHEFGSKGGILCVQPRAQSFNDFKVKANPFFKGVD